MPPPAPALRLQAWARPVRDLRRAVAFYTAALGFEATTSDADPGDEGLPTALAHAWGLPAEGLRAIRTLRLSRETLLLAECDASPGAPDDGATDPRFQHIALVTADMAAAWDRALRRGGSFGRISADGPQTLPAASGGAVAVKFRDPDGHPVELLQFAAGRVPAHWQGDGALTRGIDHSAITVADAGRSIAFYRDALGLGLGPGPLQVNRGPEQARLDGVPAPAVDVVALSTARPGPHLELLGYHGLQAHAVPTGPRTCTLWQHATDDSAGSPFIRCLSDPDGHAHLILPTSFPLP